MNILIAPDKFKDALDAHAVAAALADGVRRVCPDALIECRPLGDGGEGTGRLLAEAAGAEQRECAVLDPLYRMLMSRWWLDRANDAAIVEMAEASGLSILLHGERDAFRTISYGTGELIKAAIDAGCRDVTLCVGGSATVDGGVGCLQALGWRMLDSAGEELEKLLSGGNLGLVAELAPPASEITAEITILCDVTNPLLGENGAAEVFAPQKGANPWQVARLEKNLRQWAGVLQRATGCDVRDLRYGGAAGGLPAALFAVLGARLVSGFDEVARRVGLREKIARCDLVITGEGRIDSQTASGKTVAGVASLAGELNKPVVAFVGAASLASGDSVELLAKDLGLGKIVAVTPPDTPLDAALAQTGENLTRAVADYLRAET